MNIFISSSSLRELCIKEGCKDSSEQLEWFWVISQQNKIFLDESVPDELDQDDPLFIFSLNYGSDFEKSPNNYNNPNISDNIFLDGSQSAYLLDTNIDIAKNIQRKYGVICQSTRDLSICPLVEQAKLWSLDTEEKNHSWKELFQSDTKVPSNALIIIDRYLFSYDGDSSFVDGINNIKQILSSVVPRTLECPYQVLILFDETKNDRNFSIEYFREELCNFVEEELDCSFPIEIELLSINKDCNNYGDTHNRRILMNYAVVSTDHLLKAFRSDGRSVICDQDIKIEYLYSGGLYDRSDASDKKARKLLKGIRALANDRHSKYYSILSTHATQHVTNRLICSNN